MDELLNTFENTAEENAPAVDNTAAQDTAAQNAAAQDTATQNTAPQSELVYCPACFRAVPRGVICPICMTRLSGFEQPAAAGYQPAYAPPRYGYTAPRVAAQYYTPPQVQYVPTPPPVQPYMPPAPPVAPIAPPQAAYMPPVQPVIPQVPNCNAGMPMSFGQAPQYTAPAPQPKAAVQSAPCAGQQGFYPPPFAPMPAKKGLGTGMKWLIGVVLGLLVLAFVTIGFLILYPAIERDFYNGSYSSPFGSGEFIPPFEGDNSGDAENMPYPNVENVLPQYFMNDPITQGGIHYQFTYCHKMDKDGVGYLAIGMTVENKSKTSLTLTPDMFKLLDTENNYCEYYISDDKTTLSRSVLLPDEKIEKELRYKLESDEFEYMPLYVFDKAGSKLFYVYLQGVK